MSNASVFLWALTAPRSTMKQSPLLKLAQSRGTSVALTTRRPLTWKSRLALRSLVITCWNPDATPPAWSHKETMFFFSSYSMNHFLTPCISSVGKTTNSCTNILNCLLKKIHTNTSYQILKIKSQKAEA